MGGWRQASVVSLTAWAPDVHSRAVDAPRLGRRVDRWLQHQRSEVHQVSGPLIPSALAEWGTTALERALAPSTWWERDGLGRLALMARGRALPLVGQVRQQPSRSVASAVSADVGEAAAALVPHRGRVIGWADRGGAETHLMGHRQRGAGPGRRRFNSRVGLARGGPRPGHAKRLAWVWGEARCGHHGSLTTGPAGPVPPA